jgi:hypothetical protein
MHAIKTVTPTTNAPIPTKTSLAGNHAGLTTGLGCGGRL